MVEITTTQKLDGSPRGSNWRSYILEGSVSPTYSSTNVMFVRIALPNGEPDPGRLYAMGWKQSLEQDSNPSNPMSIQTSPALPDGQYEIGSVVETVDQNETMNTMYINHWQLQPASNDVPAFVALQTRLYNLIGIQPSQMPISRMGIWVLVNRVTGPLYDSGGTQGGLLGVIYANTNYPPPLLSGAVLANPDNPNYTPGSNRNLIVGLLGLLFFFMRRK